MKNSKKTIMKRKLIKRISRKRIPYSLLRFLQHHDCNKDVRLDFDALENFLRIVKKTEV